MAKLDARKRYTQMILKQSFLKLLKEKPVNKITVKELCELSQINRATFYTHYSDCFALQKQSALTVQLKLNQHSPPVC